MKISIFVSAKLFLTAWWPPRRPADYGKRNEMEMDVALGAGGQKGGGLGEGGLIVALGPRVGGFFLRL